MIDVEKKLKEKHLKEEIKISLLEKKAILSKDKTVNK